MRNWSLHSMRQTTAWSGGRGAQCGLSGPKGDEEGFCVWAEAAAARDWHVWRALI